jgi:chitinase
MLNGIYTLSATNTVYPSIGGWSLSDPFPAMAANPDARKNFARQCVALIKNYNFDGIGKS